MMTAEELRLYRRKRRRILVIGLLILLVLVLGFFTARPARDAIKSFQSRRHAQKAFANIEQERWQEGRDEAVAAYQLRPNEPQALRAVARFLSRTRQSEALDFWKQLQDRQSLTREDRRDQAAIALAADDLSTAEAAVNDLLTQTDSSAQPQDWLLAAQVSSQRSANEEALNFTQKILDAPSVEERLQLQAAIMTIAIAARETPPASTDNAWARIQKLAEGKTKTSLDALAVLAQRAISAPGGTSSVSSPEKKDDTEVVPPTNFSDVDLARALENHPLATASHKLLALDLQSHAHALDHDAIVSRAIDEWKNGDAPSLLALATWLNGKGEYQKTLDAIPLDKALQSRELFLQHVDALGALDRWEEIRHVLESQRFPLDQTIEHMYLARCYAQLGQATASENNWQRALEAAANDPGKLLTLAEYAEKNGKIDIAQTAYDRATGAAPKLRVAQQGRLRLAQAARDTKRIHAVLAEMLKQWPNDNAIQNDEAYTRLLLFGTDEGGRMQDENQSIVDLAEKLVRQNPRSLPHRTLLALAYYRLGRYADALAVYEDIQLERGALTPSALTVHAIVLAANAKIDIAQSEAKTVPEERLLPEEKDLLDSVPER
jgi:tetratricopeptide (TPR) repeat protein